MWCSTVTQSCQEQELVSLAGSGPYKRSVNPDQAVCVALKHFLPVLKGRPVLIWTDDTAVVSHINHQGLSSRLFLLQVCRTMLQMQQTPPLEGRTLPRIGGDDLSQVQLLWDSAFEAMTNCPIWFSLGQDVVTHT